MVRSAPTLLACSFTLSSARAYCSIKTGDHGVPKGITPAICATTKIASRDARRPRMFRTKVTGCDAPAAFYPDTTRCGAADMPHCEARSPPLDHLRPVTIDRLG